MIDKDNKGAIPFNWNISGKVPPDRLTKFGIAIHGLVRQYGGDDFEIEPALGKQSVTKFGDLPQFALAIRQTPADGISVERSLKEHVDTLHTEGGCSCPLSYRFTEQGEEGFDRVGLAQVVTMVSAGGLKINKIGRAGTNFLQQYFDANPLTEAERAELDTIPLPEV